MLTITADGFSRDCSGLCRRDFLRVGALGLGGLTLPGLLAAKSEAAGSDFLRKKSIVLVFLGGGASHIETFNPAMDSPSPYCSVTGDVQTSIPGVRFGGTFPKLAAMAERLAVVRSFQHPVGDHDGAIVHVMSGGSNPTGKKDDPRGFSMSSVYTRIRGTNHPESGLPTNVLLTAPETDSQFRTERGRVQRGAAPGSLSSVYAPFELEPMFEKQAEQKSSSRRSSSRPNDREVALDNMQLHVPLDRFEDRRSLLSQLDRYQRRLDQSLDFAASDNFSQQALDIVVRGVSQAFDLSKEDPRLIERYDTSHCWIGNKKQRPKDMRRSTLGAQMLMARRLVEAGCGFVTVQAAGWDNHADGNNPNMKDGMEMLGPPLDQALSTFLQDLEERGLANDVLLVLTGDFGRTPRLNKGGGRDHWANLCTLAFAGGGLKMGQVIGQSARRNDVPATDPISTPNLMATVMHALVDVGQLRLQSAMPVDMLRFIESAPRIEPLF